MSHTCLSTVWQRYLLNVFVDICWLYLTQQLLVWVTFCCMMLKEAGVTWICITSIRHSHCNWRNQQMRFKVKGICFCIYQINSDQLFTWISNVENKHLNIWFKILFRFVNEMFRMMLSYLICNYLNKKYIYLFNRQFALPLINVFLLSFIKNVISFSMTTNYTWKLPNMQSEILQVLVQQQTLKMM